MYFGYNKQPGYCPARRLPRAHQQSDSRLALNYVITKKQLHFRLFVPKEIAWRGQWKMFAAKRSFDNRPLQRAAAETFILQTLIKLAAGKIAPVIERGYCEFTHSVRMICAKSLRDRAGRRIRIA